MNKKEMQKKCPKPLQELTLLDRFLFDTAMANPEICQNVLSIILNERNISNVTIGIAEKTLEPFYDSRAVRLDLLAFDDMDTVYDAEAQKENKGRRATCRRSRLYQAYIDVNLLSPGETNFGKLNDTYVIFICPFDLFGYKKYRYTFRMTCDEVPGLVMNDGATRIFLNTHGTNDDEVSKELIEFLHYAENSITDAKEIVSPRVKQLVKQVDDIKSSQEVSVKYMRFWEELVDARKEGKKLTKIELVRENLENGCELSLMAHFLKENPENIELINHAIHENPEADDEEILELIKEQWVE